MKTNKTIGAVLVILALAALLFLLFQPSWMTAGITVCFLLGYLMSATLGVILLLQAHHLLPDSLYVEVED